MAGGKRVKVLAWALFQTAVLGNWLRTSNVPFLRSMLSWPRSMLSREPLVPLFQSILSAPSLEEPTDSQPVVCALAAITPATCSSETTNGLLPQFVSLCQRHGKDCLLQQHRTAVAPF